MLESNKNYEKLRGEYPLFIYKSYSLEKDEHNIYISYDFEIEGLSPFHPTVRVETDNLAVVNKFDSPVGRKIVFSLGLVEAVSYLKAACCPTMRIDCGYINEKSRLWWKKLYFNGLGEFFYRNNIDASFDSFLNIECAGEDADAQEEKVFLTHKSVVPVGGGKDSAVTAEIIKKNHPDLLFFTVNSQKARTDTVLAAGYTENDIIKTHRTISPELLELNKRGFLNGHTPFSAVVAFLSLYCAYLTGSENIILSNEASANEGNIEGSAVNHQYSKSYEFESDFNAYVSENIMSGVRYFSILRPFGELQIAKEFCRHEEYLYKFRSCNKGSKKNIWCCCCSKCLFVFSMLAAFLPIEKVSDIFGENLLDKESLLPDFDGLVGLSPVKPFECVGTAEEVKYALALISEKLKKENKPLPLLLKRFDISFTSSEILKEPIMSGFNESHNIPDEFMKDVKEMYGYVSQGAC